MRSALGNARKRSSQFQDLGAEDFGAKLITELPVIPSDLSQSTELAEAVIDCLVQSQRLLSLSQCLADMPLNSQQSPEQEAGQR